MSPDTQNLPVPSMAKLPDVGSAPVFGSPTGTKPKQKSQVASFLNSASLPTPGETGTKTLTGT